MPLSKRPRGFEEEPDAAQIAARTISEEQLLEHLGNEITRLRSGGLPLTVISVIAQLLPDEHMHPGEMDLAAVAFARALRAHDVMAVLGEGAMVAVIGADAGGGRVVAHRVAADLAIRSHGSATRKWLAGSALFPKDGEDAHTLVQLAIDRAR